MCAVPLTMPWPQASRGKYHDVSTVSDTSEMKASGLASACSGHTVDGTQTGEWKALLTY